MTATQQLPQHFVDSADGARIAVYEEGNPEGPTVVLVHGFPDSHVLWDGVVPLLADRFRILRYDNRGVGESSVPKPVSAYTMARFADDFAAVTGELSPGGPVHVLAHDWGSVGVWEYLNRPGAGDRVAVLHVGVRPQSGATGRLHLQRSAPALAPAHASPGRSARRCGSPTCCCFSIPVLAPLFLRLTLSHPGGAAQRGRQHPRRADPSLRRLGHRRRPFGEDLPRQLLSVVLRVAPARPRRRRAGAADRQHPGQVRAALRLRRRRALGAAAVAARHPRPVTCRRCRTRR